MATSSITLSFDIGHSSIGWAAFESTPSSRLPDLLGTGVLIFPANSCLARDRSSKRRQRRNIASRRNRIKRLRNLMLHLGELSVEELDAIHPWPWLLAAQALADPHKMLTWQEIWFILRWYAHNRGYDGNALWANRDDTNGEEDAKRVVSAEKLRADLKAESMAETICRYLEVNIANPGDLELRKRFKEQSVAFPRILVEGEVRRILEAQSIHHPKCDNAFIACVTEDHTAYPGFDPKLPKRFSKGGLLFGQLTPRFDNRVIGVCRLSETNEKLPSAHCRDYLNYRWAKLLCNLRVIDESAGGSRELTVDERYRLTELGNCIGHFSKTNLKNALEEVTRCSAAQLDAMILTEEFEEAFTVDPVKRALLQPFGVQRTLPDLERVEALWSVIPKPVRKRLFTGRRMTYRSIKNEAARFGVPAEEFDTAVEELLRSVRSGRKPIKNSPSLSSIQDTTVFVPTLDGRARYCRRLLKKAVEEAMNGIDPHGPDGCLFEDHYERTRNDKTPIDKMTNNHLVRHRMKLFKKLIGQLVAQFENPERSVTNVVIEVVKDLQEFSGMNAKEVASLVGKKLSQHRRVSNKLEEDLAQIDKSGEFGAGLIRKARIADELGWTCPYTGQTYSLPEIVSGKIDVEHIVPRSLRPTDSLESLVLTFRSVNAMKGNRTGLEFIREFEGQVVPGTGLEITTASRYEDFVKRLRPRGPSSDDERRCKKRKQLLQTLHYDKRQGEFTARDLTQTSHLNKLAARVAKQFFGSRGADVLVDHVPGSVTGNVRKSWKLLGCLWKATPKVYADPKSQSGLRTKTEIREITHLHHALDAVTLGLAHLLLPRDGAFREMISRRKNDASTIARWQQLDVIGFDQNGKARLLDLPHPLTSAIADRLAECRVVHHVPKTMRGLKVEETTWRLKEMRQDGKVEIRQRRQLESRELQPNGTSKRREWKVQKENASKLIGLSGSKLARIKGAVVLSENFGIALDPEPRIIPFRLVKKQLDAIAEVNRNSQPRVLRVGQIIDVPRGRYQGAWKIASVKDNQSGLSVDMVRPHICKAQNRDVDSGMNIRLKTLLRDGLKIMDTNLAGYPCHATS